MGLKKLNELKFLVVMAKNFNNDQKFQFYFQKTLAEIEGTERGDYWLCSNQ